LTASSNLILLICCSGRRLANIGFSSSSFLPICAIGPNLPSLTLNCLPVFGSSPKILSPVSLLAFLLTSSTFVLKGL
jgi:hypothetical protein